MLRSLLIMLIFFQYRIRGKRIEKVAFHKQFGAWEFRIAGTSYLSSGPGWVYDYDYLIDQFRKLSGFHYMPENGDTVVDVGAGVGEETIILSQRVGPTGKVFAIEAHPRTFQALSYLKEVNRLNNTFLSDKALSDQPGTIQIEDSDNSLANSIIHSGSIRTYSVSAETFDQFVERNNIASIDFLKMNVEGAEQLIIKGMINSLPKIKRLAISCHDFRFHQGESEFFKTKEIVSRFFQDHGFRVKIRNTSVPMVDDYLFAINPALEQK